MAVETPKDTHFPHQRCVVQLVERWTVGGLYGHHVAIIIQTWQSLARKMPRWTFDSVSKNNKCNII